MNKGNKSELKQILTFSGSNLHEMKVINKNLKIKYPTSKNEKCNSYWINSESSITNIANTNMCGSNKKSIAEGLKSLRFHKSSIDHHKYSLERLTKSRSKLFCLMISYVPLTNNYVIDVIIFSNLKDCMK